MSLFLFIFALFYLLCSWHHAEEETGKEMAEELDKHERELENQKGNLTDSLTNLRLSSCCRLVKQYFRLLDLHSKRHYKTSDYPIILIRLKYANARLK